jgi:DNA-binding SARP family transcriptional activator|uniref:BTAD domain-containing putative transcriptional regulator n=1 Tax=Candidatus Limnocylindrus sp. TaxID=2802978 RepID=UPI00404B3990
MSSPRVHSARPRIDAALDALTDGGLALICGSAGYGKSSAVAAWGIRTDRPMRWLRASRDLSDALHLAADEDDGVRLPRLARAVRQQQLATVCAAALLADLSAPHSELTLVIDDADALANSPDGIAFLRALAERAPDRSRVALIGRRVAELRLIAARAKRQVMHIGAAALRVTPRQTRQIAEARGWSGAPTALEEARRAAAGNGGILATWLDQMREGADRTELDEFIRRDVVGGSGPLLARLARPAGEEVNPELLRTLWEEGLLIAPADQDEFGEAGWTIPRFIAETLNLPHVLGPVPKGSEVAPARPITARVISPVAVVHDLGPLSIEVAGRTIEGSAIRPRSVALLHYLATRPRHAATRDEAIDALWPEAEAQAGLNSLNQAIYHLRRALDPDYDLALQEGTPTPYIRHEAEMVTVNLDLVSFDSARLRSTLDAVRRRARVDQIDDLLDSYLGPFGVEVPFEPWAEQHRSALDVGIFTIVEREMVAAYSVGDIDRAIDLALRAVRIDPTDGAILEHLALLLEESGSIAGARRAAVRALSALREMDVAPNPALQRLSAQPQRVRPALQQ